MVGYLTKLMQDKDLEKVVANKTIVVKVGGSVMAEQKELFSDIVSIACMNSRVVLVHGGGPAINKALADQGVPTQKVAGMRITDDNTLPVVVSVLKDINSKIVTALESTGLLAQSLTPKKDGALKSSKMLHETAEGEKVDIGWVGNIEKVNDFQIDDSISQGNIPVIAPLGIDADGQLYNINADVAAAAVAGAIKADILLLVTDVPGVLKNPSDPSSVIRKLPHTEMKAMIEDGTISGGMLPKLSSCVTALEKGVKSVFILDGHGERPLVNALLNPEESGTQIVRAN